MSLEEEDQDQDEEQKQQTPPLLIKTDEILSHIISNQNGC